MRGVSRGRQLASHAPGASPGIANLGVNYISQNRLYPPVHDDCWNILQFFAKNQISWIVVVQCLLHTPPVTPLPRVGWITAMVRKAERFTG